MYASTPAVVQERVGPFVVPVRGFLQWQRAEAFDHALTWFCRNVASGTWSP